VTYKCSVCGTEIDIHKEGDRCPACFNTKFIPIQTPRDEISNEGTIPLTAEPSTTISRPDLEIETPTPVDSFDGKASNVFYLLKSWLTQWPKKIILASAVLLTIWGLVRFSNSKENPFSHYKGKTVIVTVFACNVRKQPQITGNNIIGYLKQKGARLIKEVAETEGTLWFRVNLKPQGVTDGWISENVCAIANYQGKSQIGLLKTTKLNIREGPGVSWDVIGQLEIGDLVVIDSTPNDYWLKVKLKKGKDGYIAAKYIDVFNIHTISAY